LSHCAQLLCILNLFFCFIYKNISWILDRTVQVWSVCLSLVTGSEVWGQETSFRTFGRTELQNSQSNQFCKERN
jgi:hypothetical protein